MIWLCSASPEHESVWCCDGPSATLDIGAATPAAATLSGQAPAFVADLGRVTTTTGPPASKAQVGTIFLRAEPSCRFCRTISVDRHCRGSPIGAGVPPISHWQVSRATPNSRRQFGGLPGPDPPPDAGSDQANVADICSLSSIRSPGCHSQTRLSAFGYIVTCALAIVVAEV